MTMALKMMMHQMIRRVITAILIAKAIRLFLIATPKTIAKLKLETKYWRALSTKRDLLGQSLIPRTKP